MFEKIYSDVSNELLKNNITDTNVAVSMYRNKIVDMVANYFPMYDRNLGGPQQIIEVIARQVGNKDEMEKFLDENVPKWRNYLNDRQFLSAVAISMANKYFNSKNNSYGNYENQSSEEQVYNVLLNKIRNANLNDRQKAYLKDALDKSDYFELVDYRLITEDELNDILSNSKKGPTM
ncbi:unknown [Clostridium sp. CAG:594]|nr:unknown [Clostridium sp. CAG:594]